MARIKYSGLIDSINGSIGGTTFQNNRYGFTIKRKPSGNKNATPNQQVRRNAMYSVQQEWIALTPAERSNWNTYASTFPTPTRLDPSVYLNGINLFEKYHLLRKLWTQTVLANPSGAQQTLSGLGISIQNAAGVLDADVAATVSGGNWYSLVFLSRPLRPTSNLAKNNTRFVQAANVSASYNQNMTTAYQNVFGFIPVNGDTIQYRLVWLRTDNGQIFDSGVQTQMIAEF